MSTKQLYFFATRADVEPGFRAIESQQPLKLVRIDDFYPDKAIPVIESLFATADLGSVGGRRSPRFLVLPAHKTPRATRFVQVGKRRDFPPKIAMALAIMKIRPPGGRVVYDVNQAANPSSVVFAPGTFYNKSTLLAGEIATMHEDRASMELYNLFRKELLRGFAAVNSIFVGPEAIGLLRSGCRLTIDAKAPADYDLVME